MDPRQIDLTDHFRDATEALARPRQPLGHLRTAPSDGAFGGIVVVLVVFSALASAYFVGARRNSEPSPALVSDTSRIVRVDGSRPAAGGRFFLTAVRTKQPSARVATARVAMTTAKRDAIAAALDCVAARDRRKVSINVGRLSGGSAGLMFALTIVDALEPLDVDMRIAGTGTISLSGVVGPIREIAMKARAAREAGAGVFLAPKAQAPIAVRAAPGLRVVGVDTLDEAVKKLGRRAGCHRTGGEEHR